MARESRGRGHRRQHSTTAVVTDGWQNIFTSLGTKRDSRTATVFAAPIRLNQVDCEAIYRADGIGARIVDIPANDMTRRWVTLEGDGGQEVLARMEELRAKTHVSHALRWAGLYGGAIIVLGIDDGQMLDAPLNEAAIRRIQFMRIYDRHQVQALTSDLYVDPESDKFGEPERYTITPLRGAQYRVHASRVLVFDGETVPERIRQTNDGWGDSRLQRPYYALRDLAAASGASIAIMQDFIQAVLKMKNLGDLLMAGEDKAVLKRLEILGLSKSIINTMLIDADEEDYTKHASSVAGIPDILDRAMLMLSAATGIPATRLFGRAPAGMNATGESDLAQWHEELAGEQDAALRPQLERLVRLLYLEREGATKGKEPEVWTLGFKPLAEPTEAQQAETAGKWVDAVSKAVDYMLMDDEAARQLLESKGIKTVGGQAKAASAPDPRVEELRRLRRQVTRREPEEGAE